MEIECNIWHISLNPVNQLDWKISIVKERKTEMYVYHKMKPADFIDNLIFLWRHREAHIPVKSFFKISFKYYINARLSTLWLFPVTQIWWTGLRIFWLTDALHRTNPTNPALNNENLTLNKEIATSSGDNNDLQLNICN